MEAYKYLLLLLLAFVVSVHPTAGCAPTMKKEPAGENGKESVKGEEPGRGEGRSESIDSAGDGAVARDDEPADAAVSDVREPVDAAVGDAAEPVEPAVSDTVEPGPKDEQVVDLTIDGGVREEGLEGERGQGEEPRRIEERGAGESKEQRSRDGLEVAGEVPDAVVGEGAGVEGEGGPEEPRGDEGFGEPVLPCFKDPQLGQICTAGKGVCAVAGRFACASSGLTVVCSAREDTSKKTAESCNGKDDDCDGQTDEGLSRDCWGHCGRGKEQCQAGTWLPCDVRQPTKEVCGDNVDNDCDGLVDNGCPCAAGEVRCPSGCKNLKTDPDNCGSCGKYCGAWNDFVCCDGVCCMTGSRPAFVACCKKQCVRLNTNQNCGSCGKVCPSGSNCFGDPGLYCQ